MQIQRKCHRRAGRATLIQRTLLYLGGSLGERLSPCVLVFGLAGLAETPAAQNRISNGHLEEAGSPIPERMAQNGASEAPSAPKSADAAASELFKGVWMVSKDATAEEKPLSPDKASMVNLRNTLLSI